MQGATAAYPVAVVLAVAHDSPAVGVIQYGAGAALFDCSVASGVGCVHGVPLISSQPAFAVALSCCVLLCMMFFFSSLLLLLFGSRLRRQVGAPIGAGMHTPHGRCGDCFICTDTHRLSASAFAPAVGGRCELFPFQLLYALLQDFKRAVFADHSFFLIWDL